MNCPRRSWTARDLASRKSNWSRATKCKFAGEDKELRENKAEMGLVMLISLALIALTMVLQFRSVMKSLVVMLTVPLGLIGALLGLWLTDSPLGFMALLAMVSLAGVMVSHIIVLSDYIEEARANGLPLEEALVQAGLARLRPVLVTVLATVGGLDSAVSHRRRAVASAHGGPHRRPAARHGADVGDAADALLRVLRETEIHQVTPRLCASPIQL